MPNLLVRLWKPHPTYHLRELNGSIFSYIIEMKSIYLGNSSKTVKSCLELDMKRESIGNKIINAKKSHNKSTCSCANLTNKQKVV